MVKEYRLFWSDKVAVSLTFLIPMLLIMIWGSIFGNADSGPRNLKLAFLNESGQAASKRIERVLDTTTAFRLIRTFPDESGREKPFDRSTIRSFVKSGSASAALVIPPGAGGDSAFGLSLILYYDPKNDAEMQVFRGMLRQTIMTAAPGFIIQNLRDQAVQFLGVDSGGRFNAEITETVERYFGVEADEIFSTATLDSLGVEGGNQMAEVMKNIVRLEEEQLVGKDVANPWATRSVGGWAIMFLMFTLTGSASSLFDEKKSGVVFRILASPVSRVHILWSKYLFNMSLGFLQLIVLFTAGGILFDIDILSNVGNLLLVVLSAAAACTSFGMFLAAVSRTSAQANGLGTFLILAMSSIGGAWFPTSMMPEFIQTISKGTIVFWSMDGFLDVLWRGSGTAEIIPNVLILFGIAAVITTLSLVQFKKGHVF